MRKNWTTEEVEYLTENYGKVRVADMMPVLGRTRRSIETKARKLGLKSQYKGSPVWANARKNLPDQHGRNHHAWRDIGEVWTDRKGMTYTKTPEGQIVKYARYLMQQLGHDLTDKVVRHKDGNPSNCDIDNLLIVTRAEHAITNSKNCKDPELRRIRIRETLGKTTFLDEILSGAFVSKSNE